MSQYIQESNFFDWLYWPVLRFRNQFRIYKGTPIEYTIQLEYDHKAKEGENGDWIPVVRFDHNAEGPHDVTEEGVHMDRFVYTGHGSKKLDEKEWDFEEINAQNLENIPRACKLFVELNIETLMRRFYYGH
ncbi:MAG: hypothetical protein ABEJ65_06335 [bacterium]